MRIAFITLGYTPLCKSGLDVSGERLVRALLGAGHHVTVIAGAHGPLTETHVHPALEIQRIPLGRSDWIGFSHRAARILRRLNSHRPFDVVHFWDVHFAYAYRGRFVASLQHSFRQRLRAWDWRHARGLSLIYQPAYYALAQVFAERPSVRRATGLLAGSTTTREEFIRAYGVPPDCIALARHGIDTTFFQPTPAANTLRVRLGIAEEEPVILFVGFVTLRKGLNYLAQALPLIDPAPRLLIVGRWSEDDRARFLHLLGTAAGRVIAPGYVPDAQMPAYYSLADVYVSPSLLEGFGLPLAESLACETPVVAARAGAVAEVVGPGGILVPPRDPIALARVISNLLTNPSLRRELGEQGREHIVAHFSIQTMLRATLEAYERFVLQRPVSSDVVYS